MAEFRTLLSGKDLRMLLQMVKHVRDACGWLSDEELEQVTSESNVPLVYLKLHYNLL